MMKRIKVLMAVLVLVGGVMSSGGVALALNDENGGTGGGGTEKGEFYDICNDQSIDETLRKTAGCNETRTVTDVGNNIINVAIGITAILAVISIVVGGVQMSLSLGDPGKINKGKAAILFGVIALVISALAAVIVNFVIGALFG